jgi:hypothetical protein
LGSVGWFLKRKFLRFDSFIDSRGTGGLLGEI